MRKRIIELAREAGLEDPAFPLDKWHNEELDKFAALIINECCEAVANSDPSPKMVLHEPYREIMNNINDHFGDEL